MTRNVRPDSLMDLADDFGIAVEPALPQGVAEHDDGGIGLELVVEAELATERWCVAQKPEEAGRHLNTAQVLGPSAVAELQIGAAVRGESLEGLQFGPIVAKVSRCHRKVRRRRRLLEQPHQPIGIPIRQRGEQNAPNSAEDGGVGTDDERQGRQRGDGEPWRPPKKPECVTHVVQQRGHRSLDEAGTRIVGRRGRLIAACVAKNRSRPGPPRDG